MTRGIGAAAAKRVGQSGATVIINYHRNREAAQRVLDEIQAAGGQGIIFQADVTRRDQVDLMIQAAREQYRAIDEMIEYEMLAECRAFLEYYRGVLYEGRFHTDMAAGVFEGVYQHIKKEGLYKI